MNINKKYCILILIISILFSISAVSANADYDESYTNQILEMNPANQEDLLEISEYKSYDDFSDDIENITDTFDMKNNYKHDESDSEEQLAFKQSSLVINGNNHIIDGSGVGKGFVFMNENANITINDLTFINCNRFILFYSGKLTLNNVNFTNDIEASADFKPLLWIEENGNLTLNYCNFNSSLLSAKYSDVAIHNSNFYNITGSESPIVINRNGLVIENSTFENLSSKYGGAINFKGDYLHIKNSTFRNVKADLTGGAILGKFFTIPSNAENAVNGMRPIKEWSIENCEFVNVSSSHNGGAIYFDLDSGSPGFRNTLHITNCDFADISSGYGGVIAEQGGDLDISNSNFTNSKASAIGGAIYTSWADLTLTNCNIINNSAKSNAGAIYFDKGKLTIDKSNFRDNIVTASSSIKESVIYANDVTANINNSTFNNGGTAIYANFADEGSTIKNVISTDLFLMNNTDYIVSVENKGIKLNLTKNSIVADTLPARYDIRDWGWASPLKYQGDNVACWAFATAGALECALLKQAGVLYNVSEDNIQNLQLKYYSEGDTRNYGVGFAYSGLGHSLSWYGVITAQDDPYDERGMFSSVAQTENRIHLQDAMIIFGGRNDTMDLIKQAVLNYGAVSIQYNFNDFNYSRTDYTDEELQPGHFITLIGWDDNYSHENFKDEDSTPDNIPKADGAWLIKDSENSALNETEGTHMGEGGYMWLSYYNPSFLAKDFYAIIPQAAAIAYIFENDIDYHVNYQTDLTGLCGFDGKYTTYSNEFTSKYTESIGAVGTYFNESGIDYSFDVYVNGEKVHTQSGISEFAGFRTIVLNEYVPVEANDTFKVVFKSNALPFQEYSRLHYIPGMSMVSEDGETWSDITLENRTVCLKVYTVAGGEKDNGTDDEPTPSPDVKPTPVPDAKPAAGKKIQTSYNSNAANHAYTVYRASDMKVICHSNVINLKALIDLFKLNMTNGHLKVYIDGTLVFDGDVDDDLSRVIFEIIEKFLGKHEITVEFTDKSGKTQTLNETIIIE